MKNEMFDLFHIAYIVISLALTVLSVYLFKKYVKEEKHKHLALKVTALVTVFLHLSPLWLDFFKDGQAFVSDNMIFPIFYCNLAMYLLLIVAFIENRESKVYKYLVTVTSYAAIIGAFVSLMYPDYYLQGSDLSWGILKSLLSHSTLMIGGLFLMFGKEFEIEKKNTIVFASSFIWFGLIGIIVNTLFAAFGLYQPNAMWLQKPPIEEVPFLNTYVIATLTGLVVYAFTIIHDKTINYFETKNETPKKLKV